MSLSIDMSDEVTLRVFSEISPDVALGLQLYGVTTGEMTSETAADKTQRWLRLFSENPLGTGLFAVARHQEEIVGFYSLIPIEMTVQGRAVRAAKAEFFVVKKEFRSRMIAPSSQSCPMELFRRLRDSAKDHGYDIILSVPSKAASIFNRQAGDVRLHVKCHTYRLPVFWSERRNPVLRRVAWWRQSRTLGNVSRQLRRCSRKQATDRGAAPQRLQKFGDSWPRSSDNELLGSSEQQLNFRFPDEHCLIYSVGEPQETPSYFVFTRPAAGREVRLVHWTNLPATFEKLASVLQDILAEMIQAKARDLILEIPAQQIPSSYCLEDAGFVKKETTMECFLADVGGQLPPSSEAASWRFTRAHMGFYQEL